MNKVKKARLRGIRVGAVLTGSHCTMEKMIPKLEVLKEEGAELFPILSYTVDQVDNRFYKVQDLKKQIEKITDKKIINTIVDAEPIGPKKLLDIVIIVPATGNTIAKLANGIIDTPALMAVKAHLRNQRPIVIAISTNDALSINARNIGLLLNMKNIYFVPFRQDDPIQKSSSLVADVDQITNTIIFALQGNQIQPIILGPMVNS